MLPNGPEFVAALLAIIRQRGIVAPLNSRYTRDEFQGLFARMEPELVVMLAPRRADEDELLMHPGFQAAQALGICVALLDRETTGASVEAGGRVCNGVHNGATNGAATNGASTNGATNGVHKVEKNGVTNGHGMKAGVASNGVSHGKANADGRLRLTLRLVEFRDGSLSPALTSAKAAVVPREEIWSEDKALMLFTSGTTGLPRPVPLSHTNLLVAMRNVIANHELSPADRAFIITPLCYIVGACGSLLATLFSGGCAVIPESLPDNFWQRCAEHEITWFYALPHTYRVLLGLPRPNGRVPSQLRFIRCGGGETPPDLYESLVALGPPLVESYGMTETGPAILCNYLTEGDGAGKKRRAHYPVPDAVDVMILPCDGPCSGPATADWDPAARLSNEPGVVGEVCLRGKNITSGYLNDPKANFEAFLSNGFFRTGDLGTILPDGYLRLMGRIKEIICKNDGKVSPAEVEHVAQSHGSVAGAACFRIADMYGGDEIGEQSCPSPPSLPIPRPDDPLPNEGDG